MTDTYETMEDVSGVMTEVLNRLERIVEHFREKGANDAANDIAKHTIASVNIINSTISPWDIATATLRPIGTQRAHVSTIRDPILANGDQHPASTTLATASWAAVAAVAPAAGNKLIKYTPEDTLQMKAAEIQPLPIVAQIPEVEREKRVVWIRGWSEERPLSEVTNRIGQGPLYSMVYSEKDTAVCLIFQFASSALALCADDQLYAKQNGQSRFGHGCEVVDGLPFPDNDDIHRMSPPLNERRRLTFARSQLFTHGMTEQRFKKDIYSIVGERNVELVWLFNTGNATVVMSAVPLARLVRSEFIKIAKSPGSPYHGVSISFSHDPYAATYGRNGVLPVGIQAKGGSPPNRRAALDEAEGWKIGSVRDSEEKVA